MGLRDVILAPDSSRHKIFFGGKGWVRCSRRIAALPCHSSSGSSRHEISWKICRFSAVRPEPRSLNKSRGLAPFSRLVPSASSVDRQMTPAWFARLSRASRFRLAHWRTGCSRSLRSRSSLAHHAACREGRGGRSRVEKRVVLARGALRSGPPVPWGESSRCFSRLLPSYPAEPSGS